ncbi:MDR family MFS transporter [Fodinicola acaciae]|uniref:MDR family MFS transporter n=1 Tax=Fodinicola acaciae TaxID=2681555 RepID=UPI0013D2D4D8|nr:MDR family MFS transporter [Fodinicola acaciae]
MATTQTTATTAAPPQLSRQRVNLVFGAVLLGILLSALDQTIVSTALPTIVADLGGGNHLSWVVTAYLLAETIATALVGKFGDMFGRKQVFLASVLVFLVGSFFCGFANSMTWLIVARGVQGVGAGGLLVTATALIADVIPLRDRGRYQGALGSVFGVVTVVGPLLGGLFVDHLSWRWAFYVNIPVGIIVLLVAVPAIPAIRAAARPIVDYLGILVIALAASGLTLVTSWGGTTYAWNSPTIIWMSVGSLILLVLFVFIELRAKEPVLPMRLFRNPVFAVATPISFIVGFAMLGGITFLPTFQQYVNGVSATESGIRMLPMVAGLLFASIVSGNVVSRTGTYKIFPIAGSVLMGCGLYLLSLMDETTNYWLSAGYMLVLGLGVGACMQVLVIAVQNTAPYADLGVATSGVTFLRTMGSSFGVAVFGTVYSNQLTEKLSAVRLPAGVSPAALQNAELLHKLPASVVQPIAHAYAQSLQVVFLAAIPVAGLAFALSLFLKQVKLRDTARVAASDMGDGFAMPDGSHENCVERAVAAIVKAGPRRMSTEVLARSQSTLGIADAWCLTRVALTRRRHGSATLSQVTVNVNAPDEVLQPAFERAVGAGLLASSASGYELTARGEAEFEKIATAWRGWVTEKFADWEPDSQEELQAALRRVSERLLGEVSYEPRHAVTA